MTDPTHSLTPGHKTLGANPGGSRGRLGGAEKSLGGAEKRLGDAKAQLGALLVRKNLVTHQQVERALQLQRRAGLRVGTNLLEAGALEEGDLLALLGEQHHLATASERDLDAVPLAVRNTIPRTLAIEHSLVPFAVHGTAISIAALGPVSTEVEQEISDVTSWWIRPAVAVEVRLLQALQKYYRVPMSARARMIVKSLDNPRPKRPALVPVVTEPDVPLSVPDETSAVRATEATPSRRRERPGRRDLTRLRDALELIDRNPVSAVVEPAVASEVAIGSSRAPTKAASSSLARIASARTPRQVASTLLDVLADRFERRVLLRVVRGTRVVGWLGDGKTVVPRELGQIDLPASESMLLAKLATDATPVVGPPPADPCVDSILRALGDRPESCVVLPLQDRAEIKALLYLDGECGKTRGSGRAQVDVGGLPALAQSAAERLSELGL